MSAISDTIMRFFNLSEYMTDRLMKAIGQIRPEIAGRRATVMVSLEKCDSSSILFYHGNGVKDPNRIKSYGAGTRSVAGYKQTYCL
jgi:hypothetical protein